MASIDKAAILFSIAITAIGAGIGLVGLADNSTTTTQNPLPVSDISYSEPTSVQPQPVSEPIQLSLIYAVNIPEGTSFIGCQETDECYIPASISINTGDTVQWINSDIAAHTVTSGSPSNGPDGIFDSSLVIPDALFEVQIDEPGNYDYFCLIHPWMVGSITVN